MSVVEAVFEDFGVCFEQVGFLGKLVCEEMLCFVQLAVEKPTDKPQGKHIFAPRHRFHIHTEALQTLHCKRRKRYGDNLYRVFEAQFHKRVVGSESRFFEIFFTERVGIVYDDTQRFQNVFIHLQGSGVHHHQHICVVAGGIDTRTDIHLKSRHTRHRTLWSTYLCGIIGEGSNLVAEYSRQAREKRARKLHSIAGVARKAYYNAVKFFHLIFIHSDIYF